MRNVLDKRAMQHGGANVIRPSSSHDMQSMRDIRASRMCVSKMQRAIHAGERLPRGSSRYRREYRVLLVGKGERTLPVHVYAARALRSALRVTRQTLSAIDHSAQRRTVRKRIVSSSAHKGNARMYVR